MIRTVKVSLKEMTAAKHGRLQALLREIKSAFNFFTKSLWTTRGKLDAQTFRRFSGGSLSCRHRTNALKTALETIVSTKKAARAFSRKAKCPELKGAIRLSSLICNVERGRGSFDYVLKISSLVPNERIVIPFKSHKRLNYWLSKPGAKLLQGATVNENYAWLWIELPDEPVKDNGKSLGIDIGINKLVVDSNGTEYGTAIKPLCHKVRRRKPGSKGKRRAQAERKDYSNKAVKSLPWNDISVLAVEDLTGLKTGKRKGRGKKFRKAIAPWTYRQVIDRATLLAQENRVRLELVDPRYTSQTCPRCGLVARENRRGEHFKCVRCNYSADADFVGALNVLTKTRGNSHESMVRESLCAVS